MKVTVEKPQIITLLYKQERSDADYGSCLWARFYLDKQNYTMSIESDCGNYSHGWVPTPKTESFLELLCRMNKYYLLDKLAHRSVVDGNRTWISIKEMLESECVDLKDSTFDDLERMCHQANQDAVIYYISSTLRNSGYDYIDDFYIAGCIEMDYEAGAKKIADVFETAIVPKLREMEG